jgi:uncharacterized membrane protein (DUF4010 family)
LNSLLKSGRSGSGVFNRGAHFFLQLAQQPRQRHAVKERYGNRGLYVVAALSGLTDVDAITLSTAQLVNAGRLNAEDGWRVVVVAAISNLIFKAGAVAALGRRRLFVRILPAYGIVITVGVLMLLYRYFAF